MTRLRVKSGTTFTNASHMGNMDHCRKGVYLPQLCDRWVDVFNRPAPLPHAGVGLPFLDNEPPEDAMSP